MNQDLQAAMAEGSQAISLRLIEEVMKRPELWDKQHERFKHVPSKLKAWSSVAVALGIKREVTQRKWKHIKDHFHKELKKVTIDHSSSQPLGTYHGTLSYFKRMLFLKDSLRERFGEGLVPEGSPHTLQIVCKYSDDSGLGNIIHNDENDDPEYGVEIDKIKTEIKNDEDPFEDDIGSSFHEVVMLPTDSPGSSPPPPSPTNKRTKSKAKSKPKSKNIPRGRIQKRHPVPQKRQPSRKSSPDPDGAGDVETEKNDEIENDDLHFFKSLLPYIKNLPPIRKLFVRSQFQSIVFQEYSTFAKRSTSD